MAFFRLDGAGAHNFWMDERRQILYAAYYNGGVVALDVSGELSGDLPDRLLGQHPSRRRGGTYIWGVQLANGSLYASDMLSASGSSPWSSRRAGYGVAAARGHRLSARATSG